MSVLDVLSWIWLVCGVVGIVIFGLCITAFVCRFAWADVFYTSRAFERLFTIWLVIWTLDLVGFVIAFIVLFIKVLFGL